jgi:nitrite reductase/ring-hydroxylating ferredoxin subunit
MSNDPAGTPPGGVRAPVPSYQDYLEQDSRPVPRFLREQAVPDFGSAPLDAERYTSQGFFDLEAERMWPRVWQMACREEELVEPGDTCVYDIVGKSFLVTRDGAGAIRAYYNSCLHRGRKLMLEGGHSESFRCPFHGITWNLDGSLRSVPCRWDFAHVTDEEWRLPEARVATWGGFVFINMDRASPPLERYLEVLPEHFARWRLEDCWKAAHVAKVIRCNWKVAQEAFMESYHVIATHPQILDLIADANAQYDVFGDHVNRNLTAFAAPSPHRGASAVSELRTLEAMLGLMGRRASASELAEKAGTSNPRAILGGLNREAFQRAYGGDYSSVTDAETLDAMVYNVFPNFSPWGGFAPNIVYRWRPLARDVGACIMEVMILKRVPKDGPRPKPVPVHWLRDEQSWSEATELPVLGPVIDQDMGNMPYVQEGLVASGSGKVQLANYQEIRIRHFHRTLDKYLRS